jgi:hypothetical protein
MALTVGQRSGSVKIGVVAKHVEVPLPVQVHCRSQMSFHNFHPSPLKFSTPRIVSFYKPVCILSFDDCLASQLRI